MCLDVWWQVLAIKLLFNVNSLVLSCNYGYVAISRHKNAREQKKKIRQQPCVGALSAKFGEFVASRRHSADMSATCAAKSTSPRASRIILPPLSMQSIVRTWKRRWLRRGSHHCQLMSCPLPMQSLTRNRKHWWWRGSYHLQMKKVTQKAKSKSCLHAVEFPSRATLASTKMLIPQPIVSR